MTKYFAIALAITLLALTAAAQAPDAKQSPTVGGIYNQFKTASGNFARAAEKMPEENYSFKPTPEVMAFGDFVGHVADTQYSFCAAAAGVERPAGSIAKTKKGKSELVAALKEAFSVCDKAFGGLNDENAVSKRVKQGQNDVALLPRLTMNNMHVYEHYGNLVTYMRMKGLVPPSSEKK